MDNSVFQSAAPKKPTPRPANDSILESLRSLGSGVGKTIAKDVTGKVATDALSSIFGAPPKQGDLQPDTALNMRPERSPFPGFRRPEVRPHTPFVVPEEPHLKQEIESIRQELKALASSIKSLNSEIQKTVTEVPVDPGIYHKNFFERLRSTLQLLREQVDDSRTWMSLQNNKKQKKGYWGSYKKHGTSFGLSNERSLATQAG
jgi:hypothetical protein